MPIVIAVENGSNVPNANSYVSVGDARIYASNRGVNLPVSDDQVAAMLIKATDYLESFRCKFQGKKTDCTQPLEWPRTGVVVCCESLPSDTIPASLIKAQSALVLVQNEGLVLQPNFGATDYVIEETVGPITTKYADPIKAGISQTFSAVEALLEPLFFASCNDVGFGFKTVRV